MVRRAAFASMIVACAAVATVVLPAREAHACGGTFCDAGPAAMPVDQAGENVLFVVDEGTVEAHIQIRYSGAPENFAWVVPVMATPEVDVGSDLFFRALLSDSSPVFSVQTERINCDEEDRSANDDASEGGFGCGLESAPPAAFDASDEDWVDEPAVRDRQVIGSYEYALLDGGTAEGVSAWLRDNGYATDDAAEPILDEYLDEGFMFVAFKLRPGTGTDQLHPVVIRYEGDEPCVPLRLTRIAAEDDMPVRVFFLGEHRVVPSNYRHVQLSPLRLDWTRARSSYEELVTMAVDEADGGHAFVTEYAGPTRVIDASGFYDRLWNEEFFRIIEPEDLTGALERKGFIACDSDGICRSQHPLVPELLARYLPAPEGVAPDDYYACSRCYDDFEGTGWDRDGFADALREQVIDPALHAQALLQSHETLTRLYTTISPHEMTRDPLFHENPSLGDVDVSYEATRIIDCEGPDRVELPDGDVIWLDEDGQTPAWDDVPAARVVEEIPAAGAPMVLADNAETIEAALTAWNAEHAPEEGDDGCGCRASRRMRGSATLIGLTLLGLVARRRRRG